MLPNSYGSVIRGGMTPMRGGDAAEFVWERPWIRPAQEWSDFTAVAAAVKPEGEGRRADVHGKLGPPVRYVTLIGLRSDEPKRVRRAMFDSMLADGATTGACRHDSHPAGENVTVPLFDAEWDAETVAKFWDEEDFDLGIEGSMGNCVFCFMKGEPAIKQIAVSINGTQSEGPSSIGWWADIEERYAGTSRDGDTGRFKFLGSHSAPSYRKIADSKHETPADRWSRTVALPPSCACTD